MRYMALAADYDGTLAHHGRVSESTVAALEKLRGTGRKLIMVTGRELDDLSGAFPHLHLFDRVVAENGALLFHPASKEILRLAEPPSEEFVQTVRQKNIAPLSVGHVIVATWKPHETVLLETIRDLGLELHVIFNKDAVMVLPANVNKATGLMAALKELNLSPHEVVGIGDAENDHAFLSLCECSVAVDNALETVKTRADFVTPEDHGKGVENLVQRLLENDLEDLQPRMQRHRLLLGHLSDGEEVNFPPYHSTLLIAGPSGSGKSTVASSFLERLQEQRYQVCIIDPEGDYAGMEGAVTVGSHEHGPTVDEILQFLKKPDVDLVVNMVGMPLADRPPFFMSLLPRLQEMRGQVGRPHWILVDEAHHLLPAAWAPGVQALPRHLDRMVFLTVHPDQVMKPVLENVRFVIAVGAEPENTIKQFAEVLEEPIPTYETKEIAEINQGHGIVTLWSRQEQNPLVRMKVQPSRAEHRRHVRKYAEGELSAERSFYFRGPEEKLNLRAQNLIAFSQIAEGVDDATWKHHLRQGDYSKWFRNGIRDEVMANEAQEIERLPDEKVSETRGLIKALIEKHYTLPTTTPIPMPGTNAATITGR